MQAVLKVVRTRQSEQSQLAMDDRAPGGHGGGIAFELGIFYILPIKLLHSDVLFILFCTVNWLYVEGLNIE